MANLQLKDGSATTHTYTGISRVGIPNDSGNIEVFIQPTGNKAITATTSTQTGIDVSGNATVSIAPTPSETKTATANGTITPTSGKLLSSVTVAIPVYNGEVQ